MIMQLAYVSTANTTMSDDALLALLEKSRKKNFRRGLGGVLLFRDGIFFQILEGRHTDVEEIFAIISADPRHRDVRIVSRQEAAERCFANWRMGFVTPEALIQANMAFTGALTSGSAETFDSTFVDSLVSAFRRGALADAVSDG